MLFLLGCVDTFTTPEGDERVRGALWIEAPLANNPDDALVIVSNSVIPCVAEEVADNAGTPADETAGALQWWEAQIASAVTREGTVLLALWLSGGTTKSAFDVGPDADTLSSGVGYRVIESVLEARDGPYFYYQVTESELDGALSGTVSLERGETDVRVIADLGEWAVDAQTEVCENTVLVRSFYEYLALQ